MARPAPLHGHRVLHVLRKLRIGSGDSQLALALALDVSQRHLSFIETAHAQPSRHLILAWAHECGASDSDRNAALRLAGLAPEPASPDLEAPQYQVVQEALLTMLEAHEPNPAFVFKSDWRMLRLNRGGQANCRLVMPQYFHRETLPDRGMDMIDAAADPDGLLWCMLEPARTGWALLGQMRAEA